VGRVVGRSKGLVVVRREPGMEQREREMEREEMEELGEEMKNEVEAESLRLKVVVEGRERMVELNACPTALSGRTRREMSQVMRGSEGESERVVRRGGRRR
jgi:glutamate/tyrosine decarboxylase-like PLP-dependent enzyme